MSSAPLFMLQIIITDKKLISEFTVHAIGLFLIVLGLVLGCISLEYKQLWLWYAGCMVSCGIGELCIFRRVLFQHQLYFKKIGLEKLGGGIFGFLIGFWTVIYVLIADPLLKRISVGLVLLVYALLMVVLVSIPLMLIKDEVPTTNIINVNTNIHKPISTNEIEINYQDQKDTDNEHHIEMNEINSIPTTHTNSNINTNTIVNINDDSIPQLKLSEIITIPQTWILIMFFCIVLTPGWGIKLASIFILKHMFNVSTYYAESVTMVYLTCYAFGRLFAFLAEWFGVKRTYIVFISIMTILLFSLPTISKSPENKELFVALLCIIGFLYGGCKALFYSVVFDVFGFKNYRLVFSFCNNGFGAAVLIGGLSSAYSFSESASLQVGYIWFYVMGGTSLLSLFIIITMKPYDYSKRKNIQQTTIE
jgi:hypothetical protein